MITKKQQQKHTKKKHRKKHYERYCKTRTNHKTFEHKGTTINNEPTTREPIHHRTNRSYSLREVLL